MLKNNLCQSIHTGGLILIIVVEKMESRNRSNIEKFFNNTAYSIVPGYHTLKLWWEKAPNAPKSTIITFSLRPFILAYCYYQDVEYETDGDFIIKTSYMFNIEDIREADTDKELLDFKNEEMIHLSDYVKRYYQNTKMMYPVTVPNQHRLRVRQLWVYIEFLLEKPPEMSMGLPLCSICHRATPNGEPDSKIPLCTKYCQDIYYDGNPAIQSDLKEPIFVLNLESAIGKLDQKRHILYTNEQIQLSIQKLRKGEQIPLETHKKEAQFIRVEKGKLTVSIYASNYLFKKTLVAQKEDSIIIPANKPHILKNKSNEPVLFYTIYAPPAHTTEEMNKDYEQAGK